MFGKTKTFGLLSGNKKDFDKFQENKKNKKVKEKKTWLAIQKVTNRMGLAFPGIVFCIFAGTILYLLKYQSMTEVANVTDFIVATMSFAVLILSYIYVRDWIKGSNTFG